MLLGGRAVEMASRRCYFVSKAVPRSRAIHGRKAHHRVNSKALDHRRVVRLQGSTALSAPQPSPIVYPLVVVAGEFALSLSFDEPGEVDFEGPGWGAGFWRRAA